MLRLAVIAVTAISLGCSSPSARRSKAPETSDSADVPADSVDAAAPDVPDEPDAPPADTPPDDVPAEEVAAPDTGPAPPACGTAEGDLPSGLVELGFDDGGFSTSFNEQFVGTLVAGKDLTVARVRQAMRFDLEHPVKIQVRYQSLGSDPATPVSIAIHPDFGHNGFDFWPISAHWEGDLCGEDVTAGEWTTFVLDPPLVIDKPQPVYVVQERRDGLSTPDWAFDVTPPAGCTNPNPNFCCVDYGDCKASYNVPDLTYFEDAGAAYYFWNGLSLSFPYDFMVRLMVEETDDVQPEDKQFQAVEGLEVGAKFAWGDYDNDGWDDLLVDGRRLLRNDNGTLVDVEDSGIDPDVGTGGVWGDYDNDGCLDLFTFVESPAVADILYKNNCDGTFLDVTEPAGIVDQQTFNPCPKDGVDQPGSPTAAATWVDLDADGLLDLYLGNEICWDAGGYFVDTVWHNEGDGTFADWTGTHGFRGGDDPDSAWGTRGTSAIDVDRDGDVDLFANNYHLNPNLFYRNDDGAFAEVGGDVGVRGVIEPGYEGSGLYGHSVGAAWGDIDGDGDFDLVIASLAHPRFFDFSDKTQILSQNGDGTFTDLQGAWETPWGDAGVRYSEGHFSPVLADFDHDGNLDLAISTAYTGRVTDFYRGNGDGTFEFDSYHAGIETFYGVGMATGDLDQDGDLDLATATTIWTNHVPGDGHWLQLRVVGDGSNRAGLGATIEVEASGKTWLRHVSGGNGHGCQDAATVHVGLGPHDVVDKVTVWFVGGETTTFEPHAADQRLWLLEGGTVFAGWAPPP